MADVKGGGPASTSRRDRARQTRRRMVEAAYRAFVTQGYGRTTMPSIAKDAGVAVQTLYFTFGTKADLLQAAYEYAVLGDDEIPPHLRAEWQAYQAEPDPVRAVELIVDGTLDVFERAAPLHAAAAGDTEARGRYEYNENLRRAGYEQLIAMLAAKHPLRDGMTPDRARDVMLVLLGPPVWTQLTRDLGWSREAARDWVTDALLDQLYGLRRNGSRA